MKKAAKVWLTAAAVLIVAGCILGGFAMNRLGWDFSKLSTAEYEEYRYELTESFSDLSVVTETADIRLVPSEETSVVCRVPKNGSHSVEVKDGVLRIGINDPENILDRIGILGGASSATVSLPGGAYGTLTVSSGTGDVTVPAAFTFEQAEITSRTSRVSYGASSRGETAVHLTTGDLSLDGVSAGSLNLSVTTGSVNVRGLTCEGDFRVGVTTGVVSLTDVTCLNLLSEGSTGEITLKNVTASGRFDITRSTGDVRFDACDAGELSVRTTTGDVTGALLTDKIFLARSNTGKIDVPETVSGGKCEIHTSTGDIRIRLP